MKDKTKKAKELLENGGWTCVLCGENGEILTSKERGVKPLLEWLKEKEENGKSFQNFSAADKVAGKAAASLYAGLGVEEVYAQVMSISARRTLERYGIAHAFGVETEGILNRKKSGSCPMETAVKNADSWEEARSCILDVIRKMQMKKR